MSVAKQAICLLVTALRKLPPARSPWPCRRVVADLNPVTSGRSDRSNASCETGGSANAPTCLAIGRGRHAVTEQRELRIREDVGYAERHPPQSDRADVHHPCGGSGEGGEVTRSNYGVTSIATEVRAMRRFARPRSQARRFERAQQLSTVIAEPQVAIVLGGRSDCQKWITSWPATCS